MLRNLIANAVKYTTKGKVLIGCRRRSGHVRLEVWDTGEGIDNDELQAIFDEYHQVDNAARERSRGLGLGLSIVKRLGDLLGHTVQVRSVPGKGSVFAIGVTEQPNQTADPAPAPDNASSAAVPRGARILIIEDDPEVRELLEVLLAEDGFMVTSAPDGVAALKLAKKAKKAPDLILSDYNLPGAMTGIEAIGKLREQIGQAVPAIILTGDISTAALRDIADHDCQQLNKPVKPKLLLRGIRRLLSAATGLPVQGGVSGP